MTVRNVVRAVVIALMVIGFCALAGNLKGRITASGGGLPGAVITAEAGSTIITAVSGKDGLYQIALEDGKYTVSVILPGFQVHKTTVQVQGDTGHDAALDAAQYEEIRVVSTSKVETRLIDSPATVSVVTAADLEKTAADDMGDVLREVPGVNVIQFSARDVNISAREESASLANSQLTLLDGRTIYLDFFGIVLWDLIPSNMNEIKQIEVVRGPASAIWGANAQTGLVNVITKSPREMVGTTLTLDASTFGRDVGENDLGAGNSFGASITHAGVANDRWSYKVSAGYYRSDPWARPTGLVPVNPERGTGGFEYPAFENSSTKQPKLDVRFDQELSNGGRLVYAAGSAGTTGIIHSGIGPFELQSGSKLSYGKVNYSKGAFKLNFFANLLDGEADNKLTSGADGNPINFVFKTDTYDLEIGHAKYWGEHHFFSYGANVRKNDFELSIAPGENGRDQWGAYLQDEITYGKFRAVLGARLDKFESLEDVVTSPRISLMYQPGDNHTLRFSYNEAFRAPSLIENYLEVAIVAGVLDLGLIDPNLAGLDFTIITQAFGNRDLVEDAVTAYELSYTGALEKSLVGLALYRNDTDDNMNFFNPPGAFYTSENPPPGWVAAGLPPVVIDLLLQQGVGFPSYFSYFNLGPVRYQGIEASLDHQFNDHWSTSVNFTWQDEPEILSDPEPFPEEEVSAPPTTQYNVSLAYANDRYFGRLGVSYKDSFFSTDVLDARYHGEADAYTMVNANAGAKWLDGRLSAGIRITNLTDEEIQEHIFADVMKRMISANLKIQF